MPITRSRLTTVHMRAREHGTRPPNLEEFLERSAIYSCQFIIDLSFKVSKIFSLHTPTPPTPSFSKSSKNIQTVRGSCSPYVAKQLNCRVCLGLPISSTDKCISQNDPVAVSAKTLKKPKKTPPKKPSDHGEYKHLILDRA